MSAYLPPRPSAHQAHAEHPPLEHEHVRVRHDQEPADLESEIDMWRPVGEVARPIVRSMIVDAAVADSISERKAKEDARHG